LDRALAGKTVTRFEAPRLVLRPLPVGTIVEGVEAVGKHCLIHFDDGRTLRTHMRMTGSWHVYRPGERWRKPGAQARIVLETDAWVAVCFAAPVVELLKPGEAERHEALASLGPDILGETFDFDESDLQAALDEFAERGRRFGAR